MPEVYPRWYEGCASVTPVGRKVCPVLHPWVREAMLGIHPWVREAMLVYTRGYESHEAHSANPGM